MTTTTTTTTTLPIEGEAEEEQHEASSTPPPIKVKSGSMIHYLQLVKTGTTLTNEDRSNIARQARDLIWGQIKAIRKYKQMARIHGTPRLHVGTNMTLFYNGFIFEGYINSSFC